MKSTDLPDLSIWLEWPKAIHKAPNGLGVYIFRSAGRTFGRFKGESDIVYIGCAGTQTIASWLNDHMPQRANVLDIAHRLKLMGHLEVAWKNSNTREEAEREEARILRNYFSDHTELPPVNRSEPKQEMREAIELLIDLGVRSNPRQSPEDVRKRAEQCLDNFIHNHPR